MTLRGEPVALRVPRNAEIDKLDAWTSRANGSWPTWSRCSKPETASICAATTLRCSDVNLPFIVATSSGPVHLDERLTVAQAKRVFAGGFAEEIAAARAEHGRVAAAKHQAEETRERAESTEKRVERVQSRNLTLIVLLVTVAVAISIAALLVSSNHESHDDHKARETERR